MKIYNTRFSKVLILIFFLKVLNTSNSRKLSTSNICFCLRATRWVWRAENSFLMISSASLMTASLRPSSSSLCLNFWVETPSSFIGAINSLLDIRGNMSFTLCNASIHVNLSSLLSALKCNFLVPLNIENRFSSDSLSLMDETYSKQQQSHSNSKTKQKLKMR